MGYNVLGRRVSLFLCSVCSMMSTASGSSGININLRSKHLSDLLRDNNYNATTTTSPQQQQQHHAKKNKDEIVAIDLSGRFDTLVCSPISSRAKDDGLDPLFRYGRSARIPLVYLGGYYDLNKGFLNAPQRLLSELVWKLQIRTSNNNSNTGTKSSRSYPVSIHLRGEKGLLQTNDYTAMLSLGSSINEKVHSTITPSFASSCC